MNKIYKNISLAVLVLVAATFVSCGSAEKKGDDEKMKKSKKVERVNEVDTIHLTKGVFRKQVTCNGKLRAVEMSNLNFTTTGELSEIKVFNGTIVKKGDLLAVLDRTKAKIALKEAQQNMEKAYVDLIDDLIGQGYDADTLDVPEVILKNTKMSSGYNNSLYKLESAKRDLDGCYLYAPFSGRVANMDSKKYQKPVGGQFCSLVDDSYFDVEFNLLEAEISEIAVGQNVVASLFIDETKQYNGTIREINPVVDDKGQVKVRARMPNRDGKLMEGMNVKLIIEREIPNMFVVPKDAVVSRDGFFVVFRMIDGAAVWTYVDVAMSNINSHVITGNAQKETEITEDDVIITSGNLNLADGTKVTAK